jgi:hypothetical protein
VLQSYSSFFQPAHCSKVNPLAHLELRIHAPESCGLWEGDRQWVLTMGHNNDTPTMERNELEYDRAAEQPKSDGAIAHCNA